MAEVWGDWPPVPLMALTDWLGTQRPRVGWIGVQQVIDYIYGCPLSLFLFAVFVGLAWCLFTVATECQKSRAG